LQEAGAKIEFAYFLNGGRASLVVLTSDGRSVEVAIVGKDGVVGTPLSVGLELGPQPAVMQIPGIGLRVKSSVLMDVLNSTPELQVKWNRYVLIQALQVAQIAACNRLHEIEQRLARWLLMCQDRVESETILVTHEFMAQMLGTGRPSVSLADGHSAAQWADREPARVGEDPQPVPDLKKLPANATSRCSTSPTACDSRRARSKFVRWVGL